MAYNREKHKIWQKKYIQKQKEKGLCIFCPNKKIENSNLCEKHYFIYLAATNLKDRNLANLIKERFYVQNKRCFFTDKKLVLGINASIDHIIPKTKSTEDFNNPHNIYWVDRQINTMKGALNAEEFINLCTIIANHFKEK